MTTATAKETTTKEEVEIEVTDTPDTLSEDSGALDMSQFTMPSQRKEMKKGEYIQTIGRRKTSTARVRLSLGTKNTKVTVNGKPLEEYFKTPELQKTVKYPMTKTKYPDAFDITALVDGGGTTGQAEAVRHGITRALVEYDLSLRTPLKRLGYLKRDPRAKERKKPGLKKARKSGQWSKR